MRGGKGGTVPLCQFLVAIRGHDGERTGKALCDRRETPRERAGLRDGGKEKADEAGRAGIIKLWLF